MLNNTVENKYKNLVALLDEYRDSEKAMQTALSFVEDKEYGEGKLEVLRMVIKDMENIIKDKPVLLLDDVLSELDSSRQNYLLKNIHQIQTFITCTGMDEFIHNQFPVNKVFEIVSGTVQNQ